MLIEQIKIALYAIRSHKMRSFLTILGIIIGVMSTIAVISIMQGFFKYFLVQFEGLGAKSIYLTPKFDTLEDVKRIKLTYEDGEALKFSIPEIEEISPFTEQGGMTRYNNNTFSVQITGCGTNFQEISNQYVEHGRFLSESDLSSAKQVCVIGADLINELHLPEDCIGNIISVGEKPFKIIGVMEKKGAFFGQSQDMGLFIPISTAIKIYGKSDLLEFVVTAKDPSYIERIQSRIEEILRKRHKITGKKGNDFRILTQEEILKEIKRFSIISTLVVGAIVGITLIVGGIGIMNIMLVSVTERTREIGIRMAVGAKRKHILTQFLMESATLSLMGGLIGVFIGFLLGHLSSLIISHFAKGFPGAHMPLGAAILGLLFSLSIGIIFGVYPAFKASHLTPVDALRYE